MNKNTPSVLIMPHHKKIETVLAVYEALGIINGKIKKSRRWTETWKVTKSSITHTIKRFNYSQKSLSVGISLLIGSTQQRHCKSSIRKNDVWFRSHNIADKTGANFDEVKDLYLVLMNQYIAGNL